MNYMLNGHNVFIILIVTFIFSVLLVHLSKYVARHIGAVDKVNEDSFRRLHKNVLPRLGGLGMFFAFLFGYVFFGTVDNRMVSIIIGAFIVVVVGMIDDIKSMKNIYKLISHIVAGCIVVFFGGLVINNITAFGLNLNFPVPLNYIFTIFFITGAINAINFIDGMDGLSSGISSIYFMTIAIIALILNKFGGLDILISVLMLGCTLGFLFHNFYPASIIAGDSGSQFMGYMIAIVAILGFKGTTLTSLVIPLLILFVPIVDTLFAIVRRKLKGQPAFKGDKDHIHHQLLKMKFSQRTSVLIIYAICILFSAVSIFYVLGDTKLAIAIYVVLMIIVLFFVARTDILFEHSKKKGKKKDD